MSIVNALVQAVLVLVIAGVWWLIATRRREPFLPWLGLTTPRIERPAGFWTLALAALIGFSLVGLVPLNALKDTPGLAVAPFTGLGWTALPGIALWAIVQTSLTEEVFFRGLLGRTLIRVWGFTVGNGIQALAFGLLHGLMFGPMLGWGVAVGLTLFAGAMGWLFGYLNERLAGGSILPSWGLHALSNIIAGCWAAFVW